MMSSFTLPLEQQLKLPVREHHLRNLSQEETQKILLIAIRYFISDARPEEKLKLQDLENYVHSLNQKQAQDIILRAIGSQMQHF